MVGRWGWGLSRFSVLAGVGLCPGRGGSLSRHGWVSVQAGVGLCPGRGRSLSRGSMYQESLSRKLSVCWDICPGDLSTGGVCLGARVSVQEDLCPRGSL